MNDDTGTEDLSRPDELQDQDPTGEVDAADGDTAASDHANGVEDTAASDHAYGVEDTANQQSASARMPTMLTPSRPLGRSARLGMIRCLEARVQDLETTLVHATESAGKDPFFSKWPQRVMELRERAAQQLEGLRKA